MAKKTGAVAKRSNESRTEVGRGSAGKAKRYGPKASEMVEKAMRKMKRGTLRSGGSGETVTTREQAIAIGLSEAKRAGGKVPDPPAKRKK